MGTQIDIACPVCGNVFRKLLKRINQVVKRSGVWTCKKCSNTIRNKLYARGIGETRTTNKGYVEIKTDNGWRRQHIHMVEQQIGRKIRSDEAVHHINGDRTDNRLGNLLLMDHGEHTKLHHQGAKRSEQAKMNIRIGKANKRGYCNA